MLKSTQKNLKTTQIKQHGSLISVFWSFFNQCFLSFICYLTLPYYVFILSPIRHKKSLWLVYKVDSLLLMLLQGLPLFLHNHTVREEEALVDLWAGCHVFRQAWIMQSPILWSWSEERECARGRKKNWDIKTMCF